MNFLLKVFVYPFLSIFLACSSLLIAIPVSLIFLLAFAIAIIVVATAGTLICLAIILGLPLVALCWLYMPSDFRTLLKQLAEKKSK